MSGATAIHGASQPSAAAVRLSWPRIARLALVQVSIGAVVVLMTSTLNRVMILEIGLPAAIPGALVGLHFAIQMFLRPRLGFASDRSGRRSPWIIGGMLLLALSGTGAAASTLVMEADRTAGLAVAIASFLMLGFSVSMVGTPFLALLAERVEAERRAGAAAMTWILMIIGFIITAATVGTLLDPFTFERLVAIAAGVGAVAMGLTVFAVWGLERTPAAVSPGRPAAPASGSEGGFRDAFREIWGETESRRFAVFVFVAMLAYSAQDLILEPFAGAVFGLPPGATTKISGVHHGGVLVGMLLTAALASRIGTLQRWAAFGCAASACALAVLISTAFGGSEAAMRGAVSALGVANGMFAVGAIGCMMGLVHVGREGRAGLRMGFWGGAQAVAYALGGFLGAAGSDVARQSLGSPALGYSAVFLVQGMLFLFAAALVSRSAAPISRSEVSFRRDGASALATATG
jgi:MFS transporter, BCD family, chlorophyll transporter